MSPPDLLPDGPSAESARAALRLSEALPPLLVSLLERRYLSDFRLGAWRLEAAEGDVTRPVLSEVLALGRAPGREEWGQAMPQALAACHDPGHALVLLLHGDGQRHRLHIGARRLPGGGSTTDYLRAQASALRAHFPGLQLGPGRVLDDGGLAGPAALLRTAPALLAVTGIPSGRGGPLPLESQSLDRLVRAIGPQQYLLMVVAEPLPPPALDEALDACRRLRSEVRSQPRRVLRQVRDRREEDTQATRAATTTENLRATSTQLGQLAAYCQLAGVPGAGLALDALLASVGAPYDARQQVSRQSREQGRQVTAGAGWSEEATVEVIDAHAEACEQLLQQHVSRLRAGRGSGWWRVAVYLAAESDGAAASAAAALRSLCSGDTTPLDPIRALALPPHRFRDAVERGQVLRLTPAAGDRGHPLGPSFDSLATCLSSQELSVLVSMPRHEVPGLPMRDHAGFALTAPPDTPRTITLGTVLDEAGRGIGRLGLTADVLNRHVFVTGATGYGKTNTCMQLLLEAYEKLGVPFLVIEPAKTEYRRLAQVPALQGSLRVYSFAGRAPFPLRINPLCPVLDASGRPAVSLLGHIDRLRAVFNASFTMYGGMPQVMEQALLEVYTERGWELYTSTNPYLPPPGPGRPPVPAEEAAALMPCLQDLYDQIEVVLIRKGYSPGIRQDMGAVLRSRLGSLMRGAKGLVLNTRRATRLEDLFGRPAVFELEELRDDEDKAFVMALVFILLSEFAEVRHRTTPPDHRGGLRHLTLIEEAHRLLQAPKGSLMAGMGDPQAKAVTMFADMLAEMRAYGEGFLIADQIPTKLAPETMKNSNLKIAHRLLAPDDREVTGRCLNLNERQIRHLNNLAPGQAVVHDERLGEAVLLAVDPVKGSRAREMLDEEVWALLEARDVGDSESLWRHAGCALCPSPCAFYHRVEGAQNQRLMARALRPVLEEVLLGGAEAAWAEWEGWRRQWQRRGHAVQGSTADIARGVTYCAVTQAVHLWLGQLLADRGKVLPENAGGPVEEPPPGVPRPWFSDRAPDDPATATPAKVNVALAGAPGLAPEELLAPADRLRRERASRALGELFLTWGDAERLGDRERAAFTRAQERLRGEVAAEPPHDVPPVGCDACPARCRLLPFVAPHLPQLTEELKTAIASGSSARERLAAVEARLGPAEQKLHLLARQPADAPVRRAWRYCVLANVVAGAAAEGGEPLLELLRANGPGRDGRGPGGESAS